jgi:hypothetical protein
MADALALKERSLLISLFVHLSSSAAWPLLLWCFFAVLSQLHQPEGFALSLW